MAWGVLGYGRGSRLRRWVRLPNPPGSSIPESPRATSVRSSGSAKPSCGAMQDLKFEVACEWHLYLGSTFKVYDTIFATWCHGIGHVFGVEPCILSILPTTLRILAVSSGGPAADPNVGRSWRLVTRRAEIRQGLHDVLDLARLGCC